MQIWGSHPWTFLAHFIHPGCIFKMMFVWFSEKENINAFVISGCYQETHDGCTIWCSSIWWTWLIPCCFGCFSLFGRFSSRTVGVTVTYVLCWIKGYKNLLWSSVDLLSLPFLEQYATAWTFLFALRTIYGTIGYCMNHSCYCCISNNFWFVGCSCFTISRWYCK